MIIKRLLVLLIAVMFILPAAVIAEDDFDDDFGFEEEKKEELFEEEKPEKEEDVFDAEKSAEEKKDEEQKESDAALDDLLGEGEEEKADEFSADSKPKERVEDILGMPEEKKALKASVASGIKPVMMVKGGLYALASHDEDLEQGKRFGGLDQAILGVEYKGNYIFGKATINARTENPLLSVVGNPLMDAAYENGGLAYEVYGGMTLFKRLFIKAGKMVPEYGIMDEYQKLGLAVGTAFGTRSLAAVEGLVPETDTGFALGFNYDLNSEDAIKFGLSMSSASALSQTYAPTDRVYNIFGRFGYVMKDMLKVYASFLYKKDYTIDGTSPRTKLSSMGGGLGAEFHMKGFEMLFTADIAMHNRWAAGTTYKSTQSVLVSLQPGYNLPLNMDVMEKFQVALRADVIRGLYSPSTSLNDAWKYGKQYYSSASLAFRIGFSANIFAKEVKGVRSFAGLTFMMQPEAEVDTGTSPKPKNYGFMTLMLQGGAEF